MRPTNRNSGFTLLEMLFVVSILAVVMLSLTQGLVVAQNMFVTSTHINRTDAEANTVITRISAEMSKTAKVGSIEPLIIDKNGYQTTEGGNYGPDTSIRFQRRIADSGGTTWGKWLHIKWFDPAESHPSSASQYKGKLVMWEDADDDSKQYPGANDNNVILAHNVSALYFTKEKNTANNFNGCITVHIEVTRSIPKSSKTYTAKLTTRVTVPVYD